MHFTCGGSFNDHFTANLLLSVLLKEFESQSISDDVMKL